MSEFASWLPLIFAFLMGFSMMIYSILDGYDLGVGILTKYASNQEKDLMISSIGPFWDANETWLVLGVGILLIAFPLASGIVLTHLYLPVTIMLIGLIFRGIAFEFRTKAKDSQQRFWNISFFFGSLVAAFSQGYMLGSYILGFSKGFDAVIFSLIVGLSVIAMYCLIGACWLIMKTEGALQKKAITWALFSLYGTVLAIAVISISTPLASERIFEKWFSFPNIIFLSPLPIGTIILFIFLYFLLKKLPKENDQYCWSPFVLTVIIYVICFAGLAYSFYPYIVPNILKINESASATGSLVIILVGALIVLPVMIGYTIFVYNVFHGKAKKINYGE